MDTGAAAGDPFAEGVVSAARLPDLCVGLAVAWRRTQVLLQAAPLQQGVYQLPGCETIVQGVTWRQPWSRRPLSLGELLSHELPVVAPMHRSCLPSSRGRCMQHQMYVNIYT